MFNIFQTPINPLTDQGLGSAGLSEGPHTVALSGAGASENGTPYIELKSKAGGSGKIYFSSSSEVASEIGRKKIVSILNACNVTVSVSSMQDFLKAIRGKVFDVKTEKGEKYTEIKYFGKAGEFTGSAQAVSQPVSDPFAGQPAQAQAAQQFAQQKPASDPFAVQPAQSSASSIFDDDVPF